MAFINFNAADVDPNSSFEPIPAGKYVAAIVDSTTKPTKNGAGEYLELVFEVLEGPYKGRRVWERLTLKHVNDTTVRIARGNLSAICRAVGVMTPADSSRSSPSAITCSTPPSATTSPSATTPRPTQPAFPARERATTRSSGTRNESEAKTPPTSSSAHGRT